MHAFIVKNVQFISSSNIRNPWGFVSFWGAYQFLSLEVPRDLVGHFEWYHLRQKLKWNQWQKTVDSQGNLEEYMASYVVSTVPADGLAPLGARSFLGTVMGKIRTWTIIIHGLEPMLNLAINTVWYYHKRRFQ